MEQGVESWLARRESASPPSAGSSDLSPPPSSSPFSHRRENDSWHPRGRISGGTTAREHGDSFGRFGGFDGGGNNLGEDDVYDFDAARYRRHGHSSISKKRQAKKESKLTPKDKAPIRTMDERVAEILARTRSPAAATAAADVSPAPASVPEDNGNRGGGVGGVGGVGEGAMTDGVGAPLGDGTGTFSDFAKSLRNFRGGLDLSPATSDGEGHLAHNENISGKGSASSEFPPKICAPALSPPLATGGTRTLLEMSDSLGIDEADVELGGYGHAREKLWQRRAVKSPEMASGAGADAPEAPTDTLFPGGSPEILAVNAAERGYGEGRGRTSVDAFKQKQEQMGEGCRGAGFEGGEAATVMEAVAVRSPRTGVMNARDDGSGRDPQEGERSVSRSPDTSYEDDGFEVDMKEEEETQQARNKGGREGADKAGAGESAKPFSWEYTASDLYSPRYGVDGGIDRGGGGGEGEAEGFSDAGVSIVGGTSPRYGRNLASVVGGVILNSPGCGITSRLTHAPHDSPPPSPPSLCLPSSVSFSASAAAAAEDERDYRAREYSRSGGVNMSLSGPVEASSTWELVGARGLARSPQESLPPSPSPSPPPSPPLSPPPSPPPPPPPPPLHSPTPDDRRNIGCNDDDDGRALGGSGNGSGSSVGAVRVRVGMPLLREVKRGEEDNVSLCDRGQHDAATMDPAGECSDASLGRGPAAPVVVGGEVAVAARVTATVPKTRLIFRSEGRGTDGYGRDDDGGDLRSSVGAHNRGTDRLAGDHSRSARGQRDNTYPRGEWRTITAAADAEVNPAASSGPWDEPTTAPSLMELERQLSPLSPLPVREARVAGDRRPGVGADANSGRRNNGGGGGGAGVTFDGRRREGRAVTGDGGVARARARSQEDSARSRNGRRSVRKNQRDLGHAGRAAVPRGGSAQAADGCGPADLSSMVLVSSLSSTPGKRMSGSGRWAEGRPQESIVRADLAFDDTSTAVRLGNITTQAERGLQEAAQQWQEEDGDGYREGNGGRYREDDRRRREKEKKEEELERDLERARAEIYALQVKLQEKKRSSMPARTLTVRDVGRGDYDVGSKNRNSHGGVSRGEETGGNQARLETAAEIEAESMRKEIAEQERLLSAYQKENERLVDKAKKDKTEHEEERVSLYRDRERLNKELNRLANEKGWGSGTKNGPSSANAVQARLQAEAELAEARTRESDLLFEVDRLRAAKRALEALAAQEAASSSKAAAAARGGDKEDLKKLEGAVKRLEGLLSQEREERSEEMRATRRKLDWYAENQELVDGHLEKMRQQEEEVDRLRQALSSKAGGKGTGRSPADIRKIKDLEAQLGELAEALRKRHPDSLVSLIRATRPSESQEIQDNCHLKRIRELEAELKKHREEGELKMRALRQQHERVKSGMERQLLAKRPRSGGVMGGYGAGFDRREKSRGCIVGGVEENSAGRSAGNPNEQEQQQQHEDRVAELEKELSHVRSFYTRKLKEVERRAQNQMRALKRGSGRDRTPPESGFVRPDAGDRRPSSRDVAADAGAAAEDDVWIAGERPTGKHVSPATTAARDAKASARSAKERGAERGGQGAGTEAETKDRGHGTLLRLRSGSPSAAAATAAASTVSRGGNASSVETREGYRHPQEEEKRGRDEAFDDSGTGLGSEESVVGSNLEDLLRAERARHGKELERERKAAEARVAALELRLVQTAQALGKAQAREQAELWGRGNARNQVATGEGRGETENNSGSGGGGGGDTSGRDEYLRVGVAGREMQQQHRARELELEIALTRERQAAASKDQERSEDMRRALEAEVLGLRAKLREPSTPSQAKYLDLSRKVEEMERRTARREEELRRVLSESREQSKIELRRLQALHAEEIRAKDALVHGFRAELDSLLVAAGRLMEGNGGGSDSGGGVRGRGSEAPGISIAARTG